MEDQKYYIKPYFVKCEQLPLLNGNNIYGITLYKINSLHSL